VKVISLKKGISFLGRFWEIERSDTSNNYFPVIMKKLKLFIFPEYTKWEILEVFSDRNAYYCLQVRANKNTGLKHFRTTCALDSYYAAQLKNFSIEKINQLTMAS